MTNLEWATEYLEKGWSVIPLKGPGNEKPKSPLENGWGTYRKQRATYANTKDWFSVPTRGIGIVTGLLSGLYVLDLDFKNNADLQFAKDRWGLDEHGPNVVLTGGGGLHFYFKYTGEKPLGLRVDMFPGIDFRGEGGFVAAPESIHESGGVYVWVQGLPLLADIPEMPDLLVEDVLSNKKLQYSEILGKGQRDNGLTSKVGKLFAKGFGVEDVFSLAVALNHTYCDPPLPESDVRRMVESIGKREEAKGDKDGKPKKTFDLKTFEEFADLYGQGEQEWIIRDWLPDASCGLVVSPPGMYKTWLLLALAVAVSTGDPFLGMYPVNNPGPVIIIQQEDAFPMLMKRFADIMNVGTFEYDGDEFSMDIPPDLPEIYFHTDRSLRFDDKEIVDLFVDKVKLIKPRLVIIDPLYSAGSTDDYMAKTATTMLFMKKVRDDTGTSFYIAHHSGKSPKEGGRARDNMWGSQFLNAWLETGWELNTADDMGAIKVVRHHKNAPEPEEIALAFNIAPGSFGVRVLDDDAPNVEEKVTALIMEGKATSITAIGKEIGMASKTSVQRLLKRMGALRGKMGYYIPGAEVE